jgi:glycosyltransferase involved in cell wall biosynthesis
MSPSNAPTATAAVCIPLYNKSDFIAKTMRSVLDQTFTDFELVILDNASTDGSAEIVRSFDDPRIVVQHNPATVPPIDNFNKVTRLSRAPFVKLLCADDLIEPAALERQVATLRGDPELAMVTSRHHVIDESGRLLARDRCLRQSDLVGKQTHRTVVRRLVRHGGNPIGNPGNVLFRRSAFDAAGGFPENGDFVTNDIAMWVKLLEHGDYYGLPETLTRFRVTSSSYSKQMGSEVSDIQRDFIDDISRQYQDDVRMRDRLVSAARAPLTRMRHHMLLAAAGASGSPRTRAARRLVAVGRSVPEVR